MGRGWPRSEHKKHKGQSTKWHTYVWTYPQFSVVLPLIVSCSLANNNNNITSVCTTDKIINLCQCLAWQFDCLLLLCTGLQKKTLRITFCLMMWRRVNNQEVQAHPSRQAPSTSWWRDSPTTSMLVSGWGSRASLKELIRQGDFLQLFYSIIYWVVFFFNGLLKF